MSAHIFIDAENVKPEIGFKAIEKFSVEYFVEQVEIIGNEANISGKYLESGDRYNIKNCFYGKNSADTWLCTEIAKAIFENPAVDVIIIVSSDRDFLAAIKLVTDRKRKVILVSEGSGHKNLKALLYDLRINPDFIELVDFKNLSANTETEKKKEAPAPMAKVLTAAEKIQKLRRKSLSPYVQDFLNKYEQNIKFISVKHNGKSPEIPFFNGVNFSTLTNVLMALRIIPNGRALMKIIAENRLKIVDNKVFIDNGTEPLKPAVNPYNDVINYFTAHAAETKSIFIKCGENVQEIPFVSGISLAMFSRLLKGYEISDDPAQIKKIIDDSLLELRDDKIFLRLEENISDDFELNLDLENLSATSLEFLTSNEGNLQILQVAQGVNQFQIPFVDGMSVTIFAGLLRELKVLGKNAKVQKFLSNNNFSVENNLVYKK